MQLLTNRPPANLTITQEGIQELMDLCLKTYFQYDGRIYEQLKGTPMGSPISGLIAEAVMQRFEESVVSQLEPKLWIRYIDDTFVIIKHTDVQKSLDFMNRTFAGLQFTVEVEKDKRLPFLDILIERSKEGALETCVYRKDTHTDQILNFASNHPKQHKVSCVPTLFARAYTHCSTPQSRLAEERYLSDVFQANGYSRSFVRNCLRNKAHPGQQGPSPEHKNQRPKLAVLPYIRGVSEIAQRLLKQQGVVTAHKPMTSLHHVISRPKDVSSKDEIINAVYQIDCRNCDKYYLGQTGRKLATRVHEHRLAIRRHEPRSLVAEHYEQFDHSFDLEGTRVLATAPTKYAREFLEAWYSSDHAINRSVNLDSSYQWLKSTKRPTRHRSNGHPNDVTS